MESVICADIILESGEHNWKWPPVPNIDNTENHSTVTKPQSSPQQTDPPLNHQLIPKPAASVKESPRFPSPIRQFLTSDAHTCAISKLSTRSRTFGTALRTADAIEGVKNEEEKCNEFENLDDEFEFNVNEPITNSDSTELLFHRRTVILPSSIGRCNLSHHHLIVMYLCWCGAMEMASVHYQFPPSRHFELDAFHSRAHLR